MQNNTDAFVAPQNISFSGTTTYAFTLLTATDVHVLLGDMASAGAACAELGHRRVVDICVTANNAVKLQILVPGETAVAGSPTGKTSVAISTQAAGVGFPVTVNAIDLNWNIVPAGAQIGLATNDPYAPAIPHAKSLQRNHDVPSDLRAKRISDPAGWMITASTVAGANLDPFAVRAGTGVRGPGHAAADPYAEPSRGPGQCHHQGGNEFRFQRHRRDSL